MTIKNTKHLLTLKDKQLEQFFTDAGFNIEMTADGSPTLRLITDQLDKAESMHHSAGAASETYYIYGSIIDSVFRSFLKNKDQFADQNLGTCIVGLGLGYIEIAWAQQVIKHNMALNLENIFFNSFEVVEKLKLNFINWVYSLDLKTVESEYKNVIYNQISEKMNKSDMSLSTNLKLNIKDIKQILQEALSKASQIHSDLLDFKSENKKWNIICYDAFSKKTTLPLWESAFLEKFLENFADKNCVFTTYACTGNLKNALKNAGFTVIKRPGFSGKRDSTLALRGCFTEDQSLFQIF